MSGSPGGARLPAWWTVSRVSAAAAVALAVAAVAFLLRFNTLGGALGGFDNDHFIYLVRTDALLAGDVPLRDFVDAELRGAWPALSYTVSAWAQQLGGRTLLSEAYLTVGLLALAHALVFLLALDLSKRWSVALLAAALAIVTFPKLYNYIKVVTLVLGVWSLRAIVVNPSARRLALAALVTAMAASFRHDLAIYVGGAILAALVARDAASWRLVARHVAIYGVFAALWLLPSLVSIQRYEGITQYARNAFDTVGATRAREDLNLLPFDWSAPLSPENVELVTYYGFLAMPIVGAVVLLACVAWRGAPRLTREERATAVGLLVMALLANSAFLRANLAERFGDAVVAVALLAAWVAGTAPRWRSTGMRRVVVLVPVLLLVEAFAANYMLSEVGRELATSRFFESWEDVRRKYAAVQDELRRMPPARWTDAEAGGTLVAARYIAECTRPGDRLLGIGPVHEIHFFARRGFAAGQAMFKLSLYTSIAHQRQALDRLRTQSVPIVIADVEEYAYFDDLYPFVAEHLASHYRDAGSIEVEGRPRFRVLVSADREPTRTDPVLGLPCFA